jgi:hypothetical protein
VLLVGQIKRLHRKRTVSAQQQQQRREQGRAGAGQRAMKSVQQGPLPPDSYEAFSCAMCFSPKAPLLPGYEAEEEQQEEVMVCSRCELQVHRRCYTDFHGELNVRTSTPAFLSCAACGEVGRRL